MASHTIKVTGVSDEMLRLLDERVRRRQAPGRSGYIRELLRKELLEDARASRARSFSEILCPIHTETAQLGLTEDEAERIIERERCQRYAEKSTSRILI